jgi:L-threonylcarbamoyladenylate synthase
VSAGDRAPSLTAADADALARCAASGGVVLFPADTVYGLGCAPDRADALERIHALKGRPASKPSAVMFFSVAPALEVLVDAGPRTRAALERLLPGPVTVLLPNPSGRFPLACGRDPGTIGIRVPRLEGALAPLTRISDPLLQTSANRAGGADARRLADVPPDIRRGADLVLDAGELGGTASTVIDLRGLEQAGEWVVVREGALSRAAVAHALG